MPFRQIFKITKQIDVILAVNNGRKLKRSLTLPRRFVFRTVGTCHPVCSLYTEIFKIETLKF